MKMKGDKKDLTWEQQVEYTRVKAWGRGVSLKFKEQNEQKKRDSFVTYDMDLNAQEILDES